MRKLYSLLVLILVAAFTLPTAASPNVCDKGDKLVGPNCVHSSWGKVGSLNQLFTTLYRTTSGTRVVVWYDEGDVVDSKIGYIKVLQLEYTSDGDRVPTVNTYKWLITEGRYDLGY